MELDIILGVLLKKNQQDGMHGLSSEWAVAYRCAIEDVAELMGVNVPWPSSNPRALEGGQNDTGKTQASD